ncbi:MAG: cell envelope integrity protein TolA [Holosporaceae bacterium]|jgi:TolA protein|nr:cell envelope integrity protein TolA [Holosporaceae bacterium]
MRRKRNDPQLGQFIAYSLLLHVVVLGIGSVSFLSPQENNLLLMDIQIAGEGELKDILDSHPQEISPISPHVTEDKAEENKTSVEDSQEEKVLQSVQQLESAAQEEITQDATKEEALEDKQSSVAEQEDMPSQKEISTETEESSKEKAEDDSREDKTINAEPVPKLEKEKEEVKAPEKKKKPKKRSRKAFMDVIKRAEKKKAKGKNRKKMLEIAEKAALRKKKNASFDKMLSGTIDDLRKNSGGRGRKGSGAGSFGYGQGLTDDDEEMIRSQIGPHWIVLAGVRNAETIVVDLQIQLRDNGDVVEVKVIDEKRYAADHIFRAAADSARRAVLKASPLKIPKDKIELFKDFTFHFDPKEVLGG